MKIQSYLIKSIFFFFQQLLAQQFYLRQKYGEAFLFFAVEPIPVFKHSRLFWQYIIDLSLPRVQAMQENEILTEKAEWSWCKVGCELKTEVDGKVKLISLMPKATFEKQGENGQTSNLQNCFHINIEKVLKYEDDLGWTWHKNNKIPLISIRVDVLSGEHEGLFRPVQQLQARLYATKLKFNSLEGRNMYLEDVELDGKTNISLEKNVGHFSGVKFKSTSYNHEGARFYLLIVVYLKGIEPEPMKIIGSALSSPIFVDSRRCARDFHEHKYLAYVDLFPPSLLSQNYEKKTGKGQKKMPITNSAQGLENYLTATNIRNKIKHPLYLAIKFSNVLNIYFHNQLFKDKSPDMIEVLKKFEKKLVKQLSQGHRKTICQQNKKTAFLITIDAPLTMKNKNKILSYLDQLQTSSILVCYEENNLSNSFVNFNSVGNLLKGYKDFYKSKKKTLNQEKAEQNMNQFNEFKEQSIFQNADLLKNSSQKKKAAYEQIGNSSKKTIKINIYEESNEQQPSNELKKQAFKRRQEQKEGMYFEQKRNKIICLNQPERNDLPEMDGMKASFSQKKESSANQFISNPNFNLSSFQPLKNPLFARCEGQFQGRQNPSYQKNAISQQVSVSSSDQNQGNDKLLIMRNEVLKNEIFNELEMNNFLMQNLISKNEVLKTKVEFLFESMKGQTQPSEQIKWSRSSQQSMKGGRRNY